MVGLAGTRWSESWRTTRSSRSSASRFGGASAVRRLGRVRLRRHHVRRLRPLTAAKLLVPVVERSGENSFPASSSTAEAARHKLYSVVIKLCSSVDTPRYARLVRTLNYSNQTLVETGPIVPGREGLLSRAANRDSGGVIKGTTSSRGPVTSRVKCSSSWAC